ncbi:MULTISPECIES: TerD family protein [unclassified Streptomyces]|uniref:TerD family protein n=1 Tax=unclassified Streptomyces TaxID=2593676 RepID=UPI00037FF173|nr:MULTISPECIES: TerD family protein [unclassified Streptomyces]MYT27952.1 phosphonate metabolism protein [Streptomyces sp. SID8354]
MTAELVRGQNHPLDRTRVEIRIAAAAPVLAAVALGDEQGRLPGAEAVAHPGAPRRAGVEVPSRVAAEQRIAVDLAALPGTVRRVSVLLVLPDGPGVPRGFGALAAPSVAVTSPDGTRLVGCTLTGLGPETALVAVELYRRRGAWRIRAVGQGYAGGLAALLHDQGLPEAAELAAEITTVTGRQPEPAGPASTPSAGQEAAPNGPEPAPATGPSHAPVAAPDPAVASRPERPTAAPAAAPTTDTPATEPGAPTTPPSVSTAPAATPATPPPGSRIDYRHPRRPTDPAAARMPSARPVAAPPAPPSAGPVAAPGAPEDPAVPVAGDANGWSMEERLYNQVRGMFEDLARSVAAYRGAAGFAASRLERELDEALADPRARMDGATEAARAASRQRHADLVGRARAVLDRDLAQLTAVSEVVEPALPPALARWDSPVWHGYEAPRQHPMAVRLGDLHLPEAPGLRIPLLVRLPLERGLWIDSGPGPYPRAGYAPEREVGRRELGSALTDAPPDEATLARLALETAVALAARLLAAHPPGAYALQVIDAAGAAGPALAPLRESGALPEPPPAGARGVAAVLGALTRRVDLLQMAVRHRATEALPPELDPAEQLVIVHDFPHGFDDRALNQLRYLADEGPAVGVHLMLVADRERAREYGPLLDPLWRALLRLTPVPDDHLADPWVGHAWTYEPPLAPRRSEVVRRVMDRVAEARRAAGSHPG